MPKKTASETQTPSPDTAEKSAPSRTSRKRKLDRVDSQMIRLLQKDGRIPNTEIAKIIGISEATVRSRLNRLTSEGYIQIVAVSNPLKIGFQIAGIMRIQADLKRIDEISAQLQDIPEIWFVVHATGGWDIHAEFYAPSMETLNETVFQKVNKIDGVLRTETSLILNFAKRRYDWGTGVDDE